MKKTTKLSLILAVLALPLAGCVTWNQGAKPIRVPESVDGNPPSVKTYRVMPRLETTRTGPVVQPTVNPEL